MSGTFSIHDELLHYACVGLQLTPTLYGLAEQHYHAVAEWVGAEGSFFYAYDPDIFPQGSFRIGTTTKPIFQNEYDLDFVLQLMVDPRVHPLRLLVELENRLKSHRTYAPMVKRLNRCVRLEYANEFHLDILPAVPDGEMGTRVKVPDRKAADWKPSDPKGYASWFEQRCRQMRLDKAAQIAPLPAIQRVEEKAVLQRVVQLSKRCRDRFAAFVADVDLSPRSIVLTTLAAQHHTGHLSTAAAMSETIRTLRERVAGSVAPIEVWNPANEKELLSEQWRANPDAYREFKNWLDYYARAWDALLAAKTIPEMQRQLATLFGDGVAQDAIVKHAAHVDELRKAGELKVSKAGALATGAGAAAIIRPNTFYGDND